MNWTDIGTILPILIYKVTYIYGKTIHIGFINSSSTALLQQWPTTLCYLESFLHCSFGRDSYNLPLQNSLHHALMGTVDKTRTQLSWNTSYTNSMCMIYLLKRFLTHLLAKCRRQGMVYKTGLVYYRTPALHAWRNGIFFFLYRGLYHIDRRILQISTKTELVAFESNM